MDMEKIYFVNGGKFTKTEMVCKALKQCTMPSDSEGYETQCSDCPYFDPDCSVSVCKQQLCDDALALLKKKPQVILCKDCKHWMPPGSGSKNVVFGQCLGRGHGLKKSGWFCADGERKEDGVT